MRICLFTDTYPPEINGVAMSTFNLRKTLMAHGHEVLLVTTNPFSNEVLVEDGVIRIPGMDLKWLYGYRASMFYNREASKYIDEFRPEVVHMQTDVGVGIFGMLTASRHHIGSVYTFHTMIEDYAYYVTKGHFDRFARHTVRAFFRMKSNIVSEFIAPSDKIKDYLHSIHIDTTVSVIPTGIDFSRFYVENEDKEKTKQLKKKLGIQDDEYVILSLGRIAKEKSIDVLLRGYAEYRKSAKIKTKFVIVGFGPDEDRLKEVAKELGIAEYVVFAGKCEPSETQDYYHLGDCFASASLTETQGLTFMEAMGASLPVIARYDDNLADTIYDGQNGFYFFDEASLPSVYEKVVSLPKEKKDAVIKNALDSIEPYSMERFYQNIMEVYTRVKRKKW